MKKTDVLKIAAILLIPGGIPVWIGYKLYERLQLQQRTRDTNTTRPIGDDGAS